jgi:hypothetical protein
MSHEVLQLLPQTLRVRGARYDFSIEATPAPDECWFEIRATDRASGRWSIINTVNAVMGELLTDIQDAADALWADTPWGVSPDECVRLVQTTMQLLTDERSLARIENALDEDRAEGEWRED